MAEFIQALSFQGYVILNGIKTGGITNSAHKKFQGYVILNGIKTPTL